VFGADGGFAPFPDRQTVRAADAAFVRADRLPPPDQEGFSRLAPDLVVEVVSPSDRMTDVTAKAMMWLDVGVCPVWAVLPSSRTVTVYGPDGVPRMLREGDELDGGEVLPDVSVPVSALFA
jgi:Uma2 family endonuclease